MKHLSKIIFSTLIAILLTFVSVTFAQARLELYQVNQNFLYPEIYIPNRIVKTNDFQSLEADLKDNSQAVNAYIIESDNNNADKSINSSHYKQEIPQYTYTKLTNEKYLFKLDKDLKNLTLIFNQTFHGAWEIRYLSDFNFDCKQNNPQPKFNTNQCINDQYNLFQDALFSISNLGEAVDSEHFIANGMVNAWNIKNVKAGTYLITFRVHNYFLLGLTISILTALIPSIYLIYGFIQSQHKNVTRFFNEKHFRNNRR